jgi:predicted TIM-barrel fold metal-dependent hydrolase
MNPLPRRKFVTLACGAVVSALAQEHTAIPILDCHVHLYDPTRPQGVPWPERGTSIYRPFLPADYRKIAEPANVVGMIEVECSPWVEDNYWVLEVAARDPIVVGTIGNLHPGKPDFREHLTRLHRNPLFLGIRFGYLWDRDLSVELQKPDFIADLKLMAEARLVLDTAGPTRVVEDVVRLSDKVPNLRIVIDHLPAADPPAETAALQNYQGMLKEIAKRPQVYVKLSEVFRRSSEGIPRDLSFYRPRLEQLYDLFGRDRVLFGSDWTNSEPMGTFAQTVNLVHEFVASKGREAEERFFWKNSAAAYRWAPRTSRQRQLSA